MFSTAPDKASLTLKDFERLVSFLRTPRSPPSSLQKFCSSSSSQSHTDSLLHFFSSLQMWEGGLFP